MDLSGPMRVESINEKRYILVIMYDNSRYTWAHFLRLKDKAPGVIIKFLKQIQVLLQALVIIVRTDNGTIFMNQVLKAYFEDVVITHQTSTVRTPQQNEVVESRNHTLVEVARTMLLFFSASLFLSDDVVATVYFTQN
ncbi:retrovirus-related pol polyprotein from transposon TNT 1-94 [Tanacetum coccineum]